jgi:CubicO group peptidase (beta-lactamase class C family)
MGEVNVISGAVDTSPSEVRYDEGRLALLERYYAKLVQSGRVRGASFLVARDGKIIAERAMGRGAEAPDAAPLRPDSMKRIASITKVLTATAVMKLVEDGVLWLDQPVASLIPEFKNPVHGGITLWHLLTHTSGLAPDPGYYAEPHPQDPFDDLHTRQDWVTKVVLAGAPRFAPGTEWAYCSAGYVVLAEVVARASGRPYPDYVQAELFEPLGMSRSFFAVPERLWPEVAWTFEDERVWQREIRDGGFQGGPPGGGGAYSTLRDLFQLGQCLLDGGVRHGRRILGKKTVQEMFRNQLSGVPAFHWGHRFKDFRHGLGWGLYADSAVIGPATVVHGGWGWSTLYVDPVERFVYVAFAQDVSDFDPVVQVHPVNIAFSGIR